MIRYACAAALLPLLLVPAAAQEEDTTQELTGGFYVVEAEEGLPATMFIGLTGAAAKTLYERLNLPEEPNECFGGTMKLLPDGGYCNADAETGEYYCSFSFEAETGKLGGGEPC